VLILNNVTLEFPFNTHALYTKKKINRKI
jgi:hypothetical protein